MSWRFRLIFGIILFVYFLLDFQNLLNQNNLIGISNMKFVKIFSNAELILPNNSAHKLNNEWIYNFTKIENVLISNRKIRDTENSNVTWSKWSKWSKCSRSCEGGVQSRTRLCLAIKSNNSSQRTISDKCIGLYKRYRLCNDKECPASERNETFRNKQCRSYDNISFRGQYYEWKEYLIAHNECELNCIKKGTNLYAKLNDSVIDGTSCTKPAIYFTNHYRGRAVCVDGICKAVHSKGAIRGDTTNDSPYRCGSVLCYPVSEVYKDINLPYGLFYITSIPRGAWNISISQIGPTKNRLVLRAPNNRFIIDGEQEVAVDTTYLFTYQSNTFEYKRHKKRMQETVTMKGFLMRTIDLMVLVKDKNPGIKYNYFLPTTTGGLDDEENEVTSEHQDYLEDKDNTDDSEEEMKNRQLNRRKPKFTWKLVGFGPCNKSCGGGYQPPIFRCVRDAPARFYTPKRCAHLEKPVFHELVYRCNTKNCPPFWQEEKLKECICHNGIGIQKTETKCMQEISNGTIVQIPNNLCTIEKPYSEISCPCPKHETEEFYKHNTERSQALLLLHETQNVADRNASVMENVSIGRTVRRNAPPVTKLKKPGTWLLSEWNNYCSVDCGTGVEYRSIYCDRQAPNSDPCDAKSTPDTTRLCESERNCGTGTWFTGRWTDCSGDCFSLLKKREVVCIRYNTIVDDTECSKHKKPETIKNCSLDEVHYCKPRWYYSEWTPCSRSCGSGVQRRTAKCFEPNLKANKLKESKECRYSERQPIFSTCNNEKCPDILNDQYVDNSEKDSHDQTCSDVFSNCNLIDKERVCKLNYYLRNCCATCNED